MSEEFKKFGLEFRGRLGLHTYPLGIKFCTEPCELSAFKRPKDFGIHLAVCQVINLARYYSMPMAFTLEDMFCIAGAYLFGLTPEFPEFLKKEATGWHTSNDEGKKYLDSKFLEHALPQGSVKAVLVAPLEHITFTPDVIDIYGTPQQIAAIGKALIWHGIIPEASFLGLSSCSSITYAYKVKKPQISIPGSGEAVWGRTEEDEISIIIPAEFVDKIFSGLEGIKKIYSYPPPKFMFYEPVAPRGYKITYKDYNIHRNF
ncbi:MAG: DUF169 domain-containing protein [Caldisphaera sp.]|nr:DUF169 domain-containing protein [Caldisphaera sp.]